MDFTEPNFRQYFPTALLFGSLVGLFLLGASYVVEVRIIVEEPRYGDVTTLARTLWRAVLGITTVGSFLIGVYTLVSDGDDSKGLPTKVEIKGTGHDINVYPSGPIGDRDDGENGGEDGGENEGEDDRGNREEDDGENGEKAQSESEGESLSSDLDDAVSDSAEEKPAN